MKPKPLTERDLARSRAELFLTPEVRDVMEKFKITRRAALRWKGKIPARYRKPENDAVLIYGIPLARLLKDLAIDQTWLAHQIGTNQSQISRYATGTQKPRPGQLAALRIVLKPFIDLQKTEKQEQAAAAAAQAEARHETRRMKTRVRVRRYRNRKMFHVK